jgi:hypothetical protein
MQRESQFRVRPQVEVLEGRELPNNFFSPLSGLGANLLKKHDDDLLAAQAANADDHNPGVAPVQSNPYGASYGEWSARWWQYALSVDADHSPFFDTTGANFAVGQSGKVWYLSGVIEFTSAGQPLPPGTLNQVTRDVTLPSGTSLFMPVLNVEEDNLVPGGPNTTYSVDQLRTFAAEAMSTAENMQCQVDGRPINDLLHYDVTSPVFSYHLPANNIDTVLTGVNVPAQTVSPAVGEGVYLMLRPLSVGQHTIHFAGDFGPGQFALDVTYHITVTPGHGK